MSIREIERALRAKGVTIDQIKCASGQVLVCHGHHGREHILWDGLGRAYVHDPEMGDEDPAFSLGLWPVHRIPQWDIAPASERGCEHWREVDLTVRVLEEWLGRHGQGDPHYELATAMLTRARTEQMIENT